MANVMSQLTAEYIDSIPQIYKDVFRAFWDFDPTREQGFGLALMSLYAILSDRYSVGHVKRACDELARNHVLRERQGLYFPTALGEKLIAAVTGESPAVVPPFSPPPA